jgi:hypothetical protein
MQCVVPLAGPQLTHPDYGLIAKYPVDGVPLLRRTIETRRWWKDGHLSARDLTFVLRAGPELEELRAAVQDWFAGCTIVLLPRVTRGALLTALAGAAAVRAIDEPLIIDLADILYDVDIDISDIFGSQAVGAAVTCFEDNDICYSYFRFSADGNVEFAAEKDVISSNASAGTYFFRSAAHFVAAAGRSLAETPHEVTVKNALFVCPVVNSVVRAGLTVVPVKANNVRSVSKLLHAR